MYMIHSLLETADYCAALGRPTVEDGDGDTRKAFVEIICPGNGLAIVLLGPFFTPDELGVGNDFVASFGAVIFFK